MIPVRQFRYRSLAYFSSNLTVDNLATCLASGHDPSAYRTFTLWNAQLHELYSPFKAHTNAMNEWGFIGYGSSWGFAESATSNIFEIRRGFEELERLVHSNPHSS